MHRVVLPHDVELEVVLVRVRVRLRLRFGVGVGDRVRVGVGVRLRLRLRANARGPHQLLVGAQPRQRDVDGRAARVLRERLVDEARLARARRPMQQQGHAHRARGGGTLRPFNPFPASEE